MRKATLFSAVLLVVLLGNSLGQSVSSPKIVKTLALTGLTNAIQSLTILTLDSKLYRVNAYYEMVATTADCDSSIEPTFQWKDDTYLPRTLSLGLRECFNKDFEQKVFIVHSLPGMPLTFSVSVSPKNAINYNVYITVEQLQ